MTSQTKRFALTDLCSLAGMSRRTVRYYIQQGLVNRPNGNRRGAYYTQEHLEQLLTVRKWQQAGLNLERIRDIITMTDSGQDIPPVKSPQPGDVAVWSHILIRPGVELHVEPGQAGLSPEELRALTRKVATLMDDMEKDNTE
jgi:DNA-binding transcriptional MerR regulator